MRPEGVTFRKTLEVVLHCTEKENRLVLFIFSDRRAIEHAFHRMADMVHSQLGPFISIRGQEQKIKFGNGSEVWFRTMDFVQELRWAGLKISQVVEDNSLDWTNRPVQYREAFAELDRYVSRRNK